MIAMFSAAVTEENAQDNSFCAISVQRLQLFSIPLIFYLLSIMSFSKFISEVFLSHLDYNLC